MVNKKASGLFRSLAYGIYGALFVFCGKLFCHFQQTVKGLHFFPYITGRNAAFQKGGKKQAVTG
jgi:hypothetical protein